MGRLRVNEIYLSIQGESSYAGWPCVFVRLTGCHLRCVYCDSEHAFYAGDWMSVDEVVARVRALLPNVEETIRTPDASPGPGGVHLERQLAGGTPAPLTEITGGEPLLQPACGDLAQHLMDAGYTVLCETSGALPIDRLPSGVIRIMDLKCPSSGECDANHWPNIDLLTPHDEVKFVIGDRDDYEWSRDVIHRYDLTRRCVILMSPVFGAIEPVRIVEWILADHLPVRFQLQMHKFIWAPDTIGV
ncbi:MAG TPA: radical SAM protein [Phycisphaerae bacterium]